MRRLLFALFFIPSFASHAPAADRQWGGFYLGGNFGHGTAKTSADYHVVGVPAFSAAETLKGWGGGGQAGYNWQRRNIVLGIETDLQATGQRANATRVCVTAVCGIGITQTSDDRIPWFGTLRARLGYATGRWLFYGTGGVGYGGFESTHTLTTTLASIITAETEKHMALVYGGGIEAAVNAQWSVKLEYLFLDTGMFSTNYSLAGVGLINERDRMTNSVVRFGINYRF